MLKYMRIYDFKMVPDRFFDIDEANCNMSFIKGDGSDLPYRDKNHLVYVLADENHVIHGLLWIAYNIISNSISLNIFRVDEDYQEENNIQTAIDFIRDNHKMDGVTKLEVATMHPEKYEEYGFTDSKVVNMEYLHRK